MKGKQNIRVSNRYANYQFELNRNITIVLGESGTGKTTLYNMIADYTREGEKSGVNLSSPSPCIALTDIDWKNQLAASKDCIIFIDEGFRDLTTVEFARAAKESGNYFVIFNRESLHNLPYSVNEIYEIKTSGKYHKFVRRYPLNDKSEYKISREKKPTVADIVLTEDSKSGYQFYAAVAEDYGITCETSGSNAAVFSWLKNHNKENVAIICDGAAFGAEIERVSKLLHTANCGRLILPESFEWMILKSGLISDVGSILVDPAEYINCEEYFSWENYFTALLIEKSRDTYLAYTKAKLNDCFLHEHERKALLSLLPETIFDRK